MPPVAASRGWQALRRRPAVLLALALLFVAALVSLLGKLIKPAEAVVKPLSREAGTDMFPAWSPDGGSVAYSRRAGGHDGYHIFVRDAQSGTPRQLTFGAASDVGPAWSPDGRWLVFARLEDGRARYLVMPPGGGAGRQVAEFAGPEEGQSVSSPGPSAAWTRDGKSLLVAGKIGRAAAILVLPAAGGEARPVTAPPEGAEDTSPAVSPDGMNLAFVRRTGAETEDVWVCDSSGGGLRRATFDEHPVHGVAWTADGREIVYSSNRAGGWRLWRVAAYGGSPREILAAGRRAQFPAVARKGKRLVYCDSPGVAAIWRAELAGPQTAQSLIRSPGRESDPSYSPDGSRIAYVSDQSGAEEIWVAGAGGANPVQVTGLKELRLSRPRWSPDGRTLVFGARALGRADIYTVAAAGGKPVLVTSSFASNPSWSHDAKWIYFDWRRQVWKMSPDGSARRQLTRRGGSNPVESPDGKWVYYYAWREISRVAAEGGEEEQVFEPGRGVPWGTLRPVGNRLYFMDWDFRERMMRISSYDLRAKEAQQAFRLSQAEFERGASFDVSPDEKYVIYPKTDGAEANLVLLEGFR